MAHVVAVPVCDGMTMLETGIVIEALGFRWSDQLDLGYDLITCGDTSGVSVVSGAKFYPEHPIDAIADADTVITTCVASVTGDELPGWSPLLRAAAARDARMVSICSGAFALAEAGLLDGRRATTHWRHAATLQRRFPEAHVTPQHLYVRDGNILTGAGSAAGLDLCLTLIRDDHGATAANRVARHLVAAPHRDGGQAQFIDHDTSPNPSDDFGVILDGILADLDQPHDTDSLARAAGVSRRTLARRFRDELGTTPMKWLTRQRIFLAMELLETTRETVEAITRRCGFESPATLRYHFVDQVGLSPTEYRSRFRLHA
ncbi:helix-turn-helix domain-containing protein [Mycolicibacterium sp. S2-37]|uniref:GlxA family transcriptional regulator n=1 Tax=Mycolicibacterium sp. S2-37 TaxID=2810297 RepID=UPI001A93FF8A|nr:helix-turn-helix domain-containing protein [Mycolicibacterium sp. S2-37]MBO0677481.1 helix-turn-helix domain-containing protein [Mycolicibacterium sp. S2-37]